jgi:hypothetical protein
MDFLTDPQEDTSLLQKVQKVMNSNVVSPKTMNVIFKIINFVIQNSLRRSLLSIFLLFICNYHIFININIKIKLLCLTIRTDEHYSKFLIQLDIITQKDNFLFPNNQHKKCKRPRVFVTLALLSVLFHIFFFFVYNGTEDRTQDL